MKLKHDWHGYGPLKKRCHTCMLIASPVNVNWRYYFEARHRRNEKYNTMYCQGFETPDPQSNEADVAIKGYLTQQHGESFSMKGGHRLTP